MQNIHGPLTYHFFLIDPPEFFQQKKGTEPESQKINFSMRNDMHFIAPLTSYLHHDVSNVKERRNSGDLTPK